MRNVDFLFTDQPFLVAICAVIVSGVLRGYSGFGAALIIIPIFSNLYSPLTALSFHVLIEMPTLLVLLPTALKTYDKKLVNFSLLSLALAVPLGFYYISFVDAVFLQLFIGVIVVVSVFLIWRGVPLRFSKNNFFFQLACAVSGFCQGLVGLGGPPVVTTLVGRQDDNITTRANIIVVMTILLISSFCSQLYADVITWFSVTLALKLFLLYLASNQIGKWLFFRHATDSYRKVTLLCLVIIGMHSIFSAIDAL